MKKRIWILPAVCLAFVLLTACGAPGQESGVEENMSENLTAGDNVTISEDIVPRREGVSGEGGESSGESIPSGKNGESVEGMKFSILGDSISTYRDWIPEENSAFYPESGAVQDVSQTWWKLVMDGLKLELCANGSSSMSACFGNSESQDPLVCTSDLRISQLAGENGEAPDFIIVYMGTNDMIGNAPIGDNDGRQPVEEGYVDNFSDGYTLMLDKLEKSYPTAQIYCCTILPLGDWGTDQPFVPFVNSSGLTSEPYAGQIRTIAGNRGIPVIDLYHCGITIDNMAQTTSDGVHPTPEGMRYIADMVMKCITEH